MVIHKFFQLFICLSSVVINAQYVIESPSVISKHHLSIETDFAFENYKMQKSFYYPSIFLKYGAGQNLELHFLTTLNHHQTLDYTFGGLGQLSLGFKTKVFEKGNNFNAYLMAQVGLHKTGSRFFHSTYPNPKIYLLFGKNFN